MWEDNKEDTVQDILETMVDFLKKVVGLSVSGIGDDPAAMSRNLPQHPPSPALDDLLPQEIEILNDVFRRQEEFERQEREEIKYMKDMINHQEGRIANQQQNVRSVMSSSLSTVCRLCCKTKFAEKIGRQCHSCGHRICSRCGLYAQDFKVTRWRCRLCQLKRDYYSKTGQWYHGTQAQPTLDTDEIWLAVQKSRSRSSSICHETAEKAVKYQETKKRHHSLHDISINKNIRNTRRDISFFAQPPTNIQWASPPVSPRDQRSPSAVWRAKSAEESGDDARLTSSRQHQTTTTIDGYRLNPSGGQTPSSSCSRGTGLICSSVESVEDASDLESRSEGSYMYNYETESNSCYRDFDISSSRQSLSKEDIDSVRMIVASTQNLTEGLNRYSQRPTSHSAEALSIQINGAPLESSSSGTESDRFNRENKGQQRRLRGDVRGLSPIFNQGQTLFGHSTDDGSISDNSSKSRARLRPIPPLMPTTTAFSAGRGTVSPKLSGRPLKAIANTNMLAAEGQTPGFHRRVFYTCPEATYDSSDTGTSTRRQHRMTTGSLCMTEDSKTPERRRTKSASIDLSEAVTTGREQTVTDDLKRTGSRQTEGPIAPVRKACRKKFRGSPMERENSTSNIKKRPKVRGWAPSDIEHHVVIHKDISDNSCRMNGLGMRVVGGKRRPDGRLGAFVTEVAPNGAAVLQGSLATGDEIVSWNGKSLENTTYEEALNIIALPGDFVHLLVRHPAQERSEKASLSPEDETDSLDAAPIKGPARKISETLSTDESSSLSSTSHYLNIRPPLVKQKRRRKLPEIPVDGLSSAKSNGSAGRILMKLQYNSNLVVNLKKVEGLKLRKSEEKGKELPNPYAMVCLLPDRMKYKSHRTTPKYSAKDAEWHKSYMFRNISENMLTNGTVEVTLWDAISIDESEFLGEVLLDICDVESCDKAVWYDIQDHDENSGPLVKPETVHQNSPALQRRGCSLEESLSMNTEEDWRQRSTSFEEKSKIGTCTMPMGKKKRRPLQSSYSDEDDEDQEQLIDTDDVVKPTPDTLSPDYVAGSDIKEEKSSFRSRMKRKVSHAIEKLQGSPNLNDSKRASSIDSNDKTQGIGEGDSVSAHSKSIQSVSSQDSANSGSPALWKKTSSRPNLYSIDLMAPPSALSQANSVEALDNIGSDTEDTGCIDCERPAPEGDDVSTQLGPGQVGPKHSSTECTVLGDIKLGVIMTKGNLEVHIMSAKGLSTGSNGQAPDTYVKTYLTDGQKKTQKKKTNIVKCNFDPMYRQKIKYSACDVYQRHIQASIWEKSPGFDKNQCLGEVVISLDKLDLSKLTSSWYKLYKQSATEQGSSDSLFY
ncbi:regulating synaptic membrane exocytosis protein 1-like isoform X2 [Lineus longissimus]|uniref:regulating synaptic membrane exocytosis protein 1-like isoform X2 n=1 Tax=Lineus longissimus TaxID=88925 RepID=UPI00315D4A7A